MSRIVVIEDEPSLLRALTINLRAAGYTVFPSATGAGGLSLAASHEPDAILLDLGLPDMDGIEVIAGLRGWSAVPIVVLSARQTSQEKVGVLDAGADDYVTKPFHMDELMARLRVAVRRGAPAAESPVIETPDFTIDLVAKTVTRGGSPVSLTPTEWAIVEVLVRHAGQLVSQKQLLHDVWGQAYEKETNYLRVYLSHLRRKLEPDPSHPRYFLTQPGMGYRFNA